MNKMNELIKDERTIRKMKELEEDVGYELYWIKKELADIHGTIAQFKMGLIYLAVAAGFLILVRIFNSGAW